MGEWKRICGERKRPQKGKNIRFLEESTSDNIIKVPLRRSPVTVGKSVTYDQNHCAKLIILERENDLLREQIKELRNTFYGIREITGRCKMLSIVTLYVSGVEEIHKQVITALNSILLSERNNQD